MDLLWHSFQPLACEGNMRSSSVVILFLLSQLTFSQTVLEFYQSAKKNNPNFKRIELEVDFQRARVKELKGAFLPTLGLEGIYFYGDKTLTSQSGWDRVDNQNAISLRTTLYNGGAEYTYFKYKDILPALAKNQKDSQLFEAFLRINALYFDNLNLNNQRKLIAKQMVSLKKRATLLKKWSRIGRVRKADYLSTLTQLKILEGQHLQILENLKTSQLNLEALTGLSLDANKVSLNLKDYTKLPSNWGRDASERPQYKFLEESINNQLQNITIQNSALMPRIDLLSNYYLSRRQFGRQDNWDLAVSFSWSFFDFGQTSARAEQERVRMRQISRDLEMSKINLNNEVKVVENQFLSQIKRNDIFRESYEVSQQNYEEQSKEFRKGLIDALDLNRALEQLIQAEISYESMKYTIAEQWGGSPQKLGNL